MKLRPLRQYKFKGILDLLIIASSMIMLLFAFYLGYSVGSHSESSTANAMLSPEVAQALSNSNNSLTTQDIRAASQTMPKHRINESQIKVYQDKVQIDLANAEWSTFTPTKSMVPFLDKGSYAIQVVPKSPESLQVGDIISYSYGNDTIIHRIIKTGNDSKGWYAIVKGDNNDQPDPFKVRFSQIKRVLVAIIY